VKQQRKFLIGCVSIPFFIVAALWLFAEWAWGGSVKPSLDAQYVPTAEYLLQFPQPTPLFLSINPPPSIQIPHQMSFNFSLLLGDKRFGCEQFCIDEVSWSGGENYHRWSQIYLNNQRIARLDVFSSRAGNLGQHGLMFNFNVNLLNGVHLFRIQIASSFNEFLHPDPNLSYEWAYRVE